MLTYLWTIYLYCLACVWCLSLGCVCVCVAGTLRQAEGGEGPVRPGIFCATLCIKPIVSARQARDTDGESTRKEMRFLAASSARLIKLGSMTTTAVSRLVLHADGPTVATGPAAEAAGAEEAAGAYGRHCRASAAAAASFVECLCPCLPPQQRVMNTPSAAC